MRFRSADFGNLIVQGLMKQIGVEHEKRDLELCNGKSPCILAILTNLCWNRRRTSRTVAEPFFDQASPSFHRHERIH